MGSKEDRDYDHKRDLAIEKGLVCTDCGGSIDEPYQDSPSQCSACYDPTPCCIQHESFMIRKDEPCPKVADND